MEWINDNPALYYTITDNGIEYKSAFYDLPEEGQEYFRKKAEEENSRKNNIHQNPWAMRMMYGFNSPLFGIGSLTK